MSYIYIYKSQRKGINSLNDNKTAKTIYSCRRWSHSQELFLCISLCHLRSTMRSSFWCPGLEEPGWRSQWQQFLSAGPQYVWDTSLQPDQNILTNVELITTDWSRQVPDSCTCVDYQGSYWNENIWKTSVFWEICGIVKVSNIFFYLFCTAQDHSSLHML